MESLPVDILFQIFSHLCFHCQHPKTFPHADTRDIRKDKKALARLCQTSKAICVVAQPVLYHYYATGNLTVESKLYWGHHQIQHIKEPDFLPQFLLTLLSRPDLASQIMTMQLVIGRAPSTPSSQAQLADRLYHAEIAKELFPYDSVPWREVHQANMQLWFATLAMVLAPRLHSVLIATDNDAGFATLKHAPQVKLPSLRTLGVMGDETDYHISELEPLYAAAPNLETMYACDAAGWSCNGTFNGYDYDLSLGNLKRLALTDLVPENLVNLLSSVPKLEDLEYHWDAYRLEWLDLASLLQPLQQTLKRLCISFLPPNSELFWPDPTGSSINFLGVKYEPIRTLREFGKLETLSIDCRSIYGEHDKDTAERLTTLLPQSIRSLRLTYVYKGMKDSLCELARVASDDFPYLKDVTVGVAERSEPEDHKAIEEMRMVDQFFNKVGISVAWKLDFLGPHGRTIIPGGSTGSNLVPVPGTYEFEDWGQEEEA